MAGGDVNGDGRSDIIITLRANDVGPFHGQVLIFTDITDTIADIVLTNLDTVVSQYGYAVCTGDFNHDGYADVAVGGHKYAPGNTMDGKVYVYYGGNPMDNLLDWSKTHPNSSEWFGCSVSSGDVNGDGIDDLIVGALGFPPNALGWVYIYFGDTLGLHLTHDAKLNGHIEAGYYENFGNSVSGGGDMTGDGIDDILVGAYNNSGNGLAAGKVYLYQGGTAIDTIPKAWFYGEGAWQWLGHGNVSIVSSDAFSFNSLGWFGTESWPLTTGLGGRGKCYAISGESTGLLTPYFTATGNNDSSGLGFWSSSSGCSDENRLEDFVAGAAYEDNGRGAVYLWLRRSPMNSDYDAYILGRYNNPPSRGDVLGARVAQAGDVDGDGKDEFLISNYFADSSHMVWFCKYTGPNAVEEQPNAFHNARPLFLTQNCPNPFASITSVRCHLPCRGRTTVKVYSINGQLVRTLVDGVMGPGAHAMTWDGRDGMGRRVTPGIYIYKLTSGINSATKKMLLIK
jgi:hypothetical protein